MRKTDLHYKILHNIQFQNVLSWFLFYTLQVEKCVYLYYLILIYFSYFWRLNWYRNISFIIICIPPYFRELNFTCICSSRKLARFSTSIIYEKRSTWMIKSSRKVFFSVLSANLFKILQCEEFHPKQFILLSKFIISLVHRFLGFFFGFFFVFFLHHIMIQIK